MNATLLSNEYNIGNNENFSASLNNNNLFDIIQKDHILSFEESNGLALLGTYVYKEGVSDSRYGYPDFYEKCLEEYNDAKAQQKKFTQPVLSENGTLGGDSFAVASSGNYTDFYAWKAFDGDLTTSWQDNATTVNTYLTFYNPIPLKVSKIKYSGTCDYGYIIKGKVFASDDNSSWEQLIEWEDVSEDHTGEIDLSQNEKYYKYYKITADDWTDKSGTFTNGFSNLEIDAFELICENTNSHKFYDIKNKTQIDEIYKKTGIAWYYGIDEENQRIFLPRIDIAYLNSNSQIPVIGNGTALGLFDGVSYFSFYNGTASGRPAVVYDKLSYGKKVGTNQTGVDSNVNGSYSRVYSITPDANNSGVIANIKDSQTYNPFYLYMVVGNVSYKKTKTEITDITTSNNDTIPLGFAMYGDYIEPNAGWVKASGSFLSGKLYENFYSKAVSKMSQPFYKGFIKNNNEEYNEYDLVLNQDEMSFRLPLKIEESIQTQKLFFHIANALENQALIDCSSVLNVLNNKLNRTELCFYPADKQIIYGGAYANKTEFDLSDILPNGLVYCFIQATISLNANGGGSIRITSDLTPFEYNEEYTNYRFSLQTNNYYGAAGCFVIPTNNKKIYIQTQGVANNCWVYLYGYQTANLGV